ncbi:MAG: hypothetical protein Kow0037_08340 [Calditrichia bacterium]
MKLTPLDIRKQEFKKTLRGFDTIEVQTFLEMVAEEYEALLEENKRLNNRVIELDTKLKDYQETEKNLRETLLNVQEVKKQSEESSRKQAELLLKEAELKAMEIVENARKQARQMRDEVNTLKTQKESFINRLRQILISQVELLSVLEIDDAIPEEARLYTDDARAKRRKQLGDRVQAAAEANPEPPQEMVGPIELAEEPEEKAAEESEFDVEEEFVQPEGETEFPPREEVDKRKSSSEEEDEINEFFKKGIQIDELIKNLDKKQK